MLFRSELPEGRRNNWSRLINNGIGYIRKWSRRCIFNGSRIDLLRVTPKESPSRGVAELNKRYIHLQSRTTIRFSENRPFPSPIPLLFNRVDYKHRLFSWHRANLTAEKRITPIQLVDTVDMPARSEFTGQPNVPFFPRGFIFRLLPANPPFPHLVVSTFHQRQRAVTVVRACRQIQ